MFVSESSRQEDTYKMWWNCLGTLFVNGQETRAIESIYPAISLSHNSRKSLINKEQQSVIVDSLRGS